MTSAPAEKNGPAWEKSREPPKEPKDSEVSPRVARRERRRERSREEIIDGARRVLLQKGVAATTLEAIAEEVGLTKAALYYYWPSKDALLFEIVYGAVHAQAQAIHDAVATVESGSDALAAIIRETVKIYAPRMDDFRLAFLHGQVARPGTVRYTPEQFQRLRPLNDLAYAGATQLLIEESKRARGRGRVEPRLLAFLASVAAIGLLTFKGMVESIGDPLIHSDEQLIDALAKIFAAAAEP